MLDLHRHWPCSGEGLESCLPHSTGRAVIQLNPEQVRLVGEMPGQMFSVGLHPWDIPADGDAVRRLISAVARAARLPNVRLIGETGLDSL